MNQRKFVLSGLEFFIIFYHLNTALNPMASIAQAIRAVITHVATIGLKLFIFLLGRGDSTVRS